MTEYFPGGTDEFNKLSQDEQRSWLQAQVRAVRAQLEDFPGRDAKDEEVGAAKKKKEQLGAALVELEIEMGIIRPPDDAS